MTDTVYKLVDAITSGDSLGIESYFNQAMAEKISDRLDDMRVNVAQSMFATESVEFDEEQLDGLYLEDYSIEELEDFMMSEDFEQLDELSKKTLASYVKKAAGGMNGLGRHAFDSGVTLGKSDAPESASAKSFGKAQKRIKGIERAADRLAKEELSLEDFSIEELEDFMMSEDFEQLDELSKKTLASYTRKAADSMAMAHGRQLTKQAAADEADRFTNRNGMVDQFKTRDELKKQLKASPKDINKEFETVVKRSRGIERATNKLAKEDYELDEEQLDELSGKTLGSYIQKARAQDNAKREQGKKLDADPKVKASSDKISDYYNRREYTKSGDSKHRKAIDKAREKIEARKKQLDPNYPQSTIPTRRKGIEKAINKLQWGKLTNEEDEQINELSKNTLGRYIKKASNNRVNVNNKMGEVEKQKDSLHNAKFNNPEIHDTVNTALDNLSKKKRDLRRKDDNRAQGISRAVNRLTKEDYELDEEQREVD